MMMKRTFVLLVVLSCREDLKRTDHVHGVEAIMKSDEDLHRLWVAVLFNDCTHCNGVLTVFWVRLDAVDKMSM